jgi:hypothetical protein
MRTLENENGHKNEKKKTALATGNGQRATGNGQRATGNGQRATGNGQRATGNGATQFNGVQFTFHNSHYLSLIYDL